MLIQAEMRRREAEGIPSAGSIYDPDVDWPVPLNPEGDDPEFMEAWRVLMGTTESPVDKDTPVYRRSLAVLQARIDRFETRQRIKLERRADMD
jgi:hypothetical protein